MKNLRYNLDEDNQYLRDENGRWIYYGILYADKNKYFVVSAVEDEDVILSMDKEEIESYINSRYEDMEDLYKQYDNSIECINKVICECVLQDDSVLECEFESMEECLEYIEKQIGKE